MYSSIFAMKASPGFRHFSTVSLSAISRFKVSFCLSPHGENTKPPTYRYPHTVPSPPSHPNSSCLSEGRRKGSLPLGSINRLTTLLYRTSMTYPWSTSTSVPCLSLRGRRRSSLGSSHQRRNSRIQESLKNQLR